MPTQGEKVLIQEERIKELQDRLRTSDEHLQTIPVLRSEEF
jgi:hypothetical protein